MRLGLSSLHAGIVLLATSAIGVAVACSITDDPRAGRGTSTSSSSSSSGSTSSSGGLDAAIDAPLECGAAPVSTEPFSKQALLGAAASCAAWRSCNFVNAAIELRNATRDGASPEVKKAAWSKAMTSWSEMELFQFGPVASVIVDKYHGRGLRSFVHPWPDLNRCQLEGQIVNKGYLAGWATVPAGTRGLFAVEYALFYPGADTVCLPASDIATKWNALAPADLSAAKDDYALAVAGNVLSVALEIWNVWPAGGESFREKLLRYDGYGSDQEALNVVAWSLIYAEKEVKDFKLASLAGVQPAPPNPETPFARIEIENIRANLRAFRRLFQGCGDDGAGLGFDDWLVSAGATALSADLLARLGAAQAAAEAFPPFTQATPQEFADFYNTVRNLTTLVKTSFFGSASPINLKLPATAASDTD